MANNTNTLNLTPVFLVWSVFFVAVAFTTGDLGLLWWAVAPWILMFSLAIFTTGLAVVTLFVMYRKGYPITLTTPRKGTRIVQRGR